MAAASASATRAARRRAHAFGAAACTALAVLLPGCGAGTPTRPDGQEAAAADGGREAALDRRRDSARARDSGETEAAARDAALDVVPESAVADHGRALAAMQAGDLVEAELVLEQLMAEYPSLPGPYVNAAILYKQDGRLDEVRDALERALALDAGHAQANNELGILLREQGEFAAAEEAYRAAIESDPSYLLPVYNLGVLLDLYLGRPSEALAYYEQYQRALAEPDETVARWIIDLRRRVGAEADGAARVAQGESP